MANYDIPIRSKFVSHIAGLRAYNQDASSFYIFVFMCFIIIIIIIILSPLLGKIFCGSRLLSR